MRNSIKLFLIPLAAICLSDCMDADSLKPEFKSGSTTLHDLASQYNCEAIEFENWEEDDARDSTLTICLINSKSVPNTFTDSSYAVLKSIALQVKNSVLHPDKYKSYNVIFIKQEGNGLSKTKVHSAGADISSEEL